MEQNSSQKDLVSVKRPRKFLQFIRKNFLLISILVSIVIGFGIGIALKASLNDSNRTSVVDWFKLPGQLFIRALELLIVPLVFIGVTTATSTLSPRNNLRISLICVGLVFLTHILATLVGLAGSLILSAASNNNLAEQVSPNATMVKQKNTFDIVADILRSLIPKNIIRASTNQEITRYYPNVENQTISFVRKVEYIDGANILGVLMFSILIGLASSVLEQKAELFREFFKSCNEVVILVLRWLILFAPVGIASLIVEAVFEVEDLGESFKKIGLFTGVCVASLIFYLFVVLALMIVVFMRENPFKYYMYFLEPALLAFASTSGAVCIHKSLEICDEKIKMDKRLSKFTIPFYTALQADGSAIFITVSCAFIANYNGISLSTGDYAVILIMTIILCLCLPSVPSSSIVTILVVLNAINVPGYNIAILYTVEWLLDRTAVNFYSHCFCAVITYRISKKDLNRVDAEQPMDADRVHDHLTLRHMPSPPLDTASKI